MINKKYATASMLAGAMFLTVGCTNSNENNSTQESMVSSTQAQSNTLMGRVSSIDGEKLTIKVSNFGMDGERPSGERPSGERPSGERPSGEKPSGEKPSGERPEMPEGGFSEMPSGERPEMPDFSNGEMPDFSNGEMPDFSERPEMSNGENMPEGFKGNKGEMSFDGEEKTLNLRADIKVVRKSNVDGESSEEVLSLSDIKVNDTIRVNYNEDNTAIESIEIMSINMDKSFENKKEA